MADSNDKEVTRKSGIVYAAVFSILTSIVVFLLVGWMLDRWLATSPWMLVGGVVFGSVVGFYQFIRLISRVS